MQDTAQKTSHRVHADEASGMLGFANVISQMVNGINPTTTAEQQPMETQATPKEEAQPQNDQSEAKINELEAKMEQMKSEMEIMVKDEISSIKDLIIESLKEDGQKD